MEFIEGKIKEYLLGDTGGKRFPTGVCPNFKDYAKSVLGPYTRLWPMQKLILKTIINTIGIFEYLPYTQWEEETLKELIYNGEHPTDDNKYRQAVVRRDPHSNSPTVVLLIIGRGGSKSFMASLIVSYLIRWLLSWPDPHRRFSLAKTKPISIQCLAGKEQQAVSLFRSVKSHVRNREDLRGCFDEFKESVNFGNVVEARAYTSNSNTVRGEDTFCYYHEETSFCAEDNPESEKSFTQCYKAIQPAVKNRFGREGLMLFVTSAGLKIGKTYQLYRQIRNGTIRNCVMFQLAVWEVNPKYTNGKKDFAQEYEEDPVTADAEHGSQFVDAVNVFLTPDEVWKPVKKDWEKQFEGQPHVEYWVRLDPSRKHDRYALALGHKEYRKEGDRERIVAVIDYVHFWQATWYDKETGEPVWQPTPTMKQRLRCEPVNPQMVLDHIENLMEKFNIVGVSSDQFESQYIIDELNERYGNEDNPFGFIIPITEKLNWLAYRNLKKLINTDCFEIYHETAYIEEASVAMRYNKNKPLETRPDDLMSGWEEDEDLESIDPIGLIYSVQAPRNGQVKTDDVLDGVAFCLWDMMTNPKMGVAGLGMLEAGGVRETTKVIEKTKAASAVIEGTLSEMPDRW